MMELEQPLVIPIGNNKRKVVTELTRPKAVTPGQLANAGVVLLDDFPAVWLECFICEAKWSPDLQPGGKLPRGYWKCPNGCNAEAK